MLTGKSCLLLLFIYSSLHGFTQTVQDFKKKLNGPLADSARLRVLNQLAWLSSSNDSAATFSYADEAMRISQATGNNFGKAKALMAKGNYFVVRSKGKEAIPYFQQAAILYAAVHNDIEVATAKEFLGKAYTYTNQNDKAIELFIEAEKVFAARQHSAGLSMVYNNLGVAYSNVGDKENSIQQYIKSLEIDERTGNTAQIHLTLNNIGRLFYDIKNYSQARHYLMQSIERSKAANDLLTMGKAQVNCGNTYILEANYAIGIPYYESALQNFEKVGFMRGMQSCNNNLGALYIRQQQYEKAIPYLEKAIASARSSGVVAGVALIEQNIAYAYTLLKRFDEAQTWFDKAEKTATQSSDLYTYGEIYNHRAELDSARGDFKSAYAYKVKYLQISEKELNEKSARQINELQAKYETQKKEGQIALLSKEDSLKGLRIRNQQLTLEQQLFQLTQNKLALSEADLELANNKLALEDQKGVILKQKLDSTQKEKSLLDLKKQNELQDLELRNKQLAVGRRNALLALLAAVLVAGVFLGYSFYRRKQLKQEARLQAEILKQQEAATKAILQAEEAERQRIAKDLHDGVGQMMSVAKMNLSAYEYKANFLNTEEKLRFEKVMQLVDESCTEVRAVAHNMMPNALLKKNLTSAVKEFINKLDSPQLTAHVHTDEFDDRLDANTEAVLYRVIQECVNNIIKHSGATVMDISLAKEPKQITVTVEDNGKGFDTTQKVEGLGLKNIRTRVQYLKGTVDIDSAPGRGTMVAIYIPV